MAKPKLIKIEIAYAKPERQCLLSLEVEEGSTIESALEQSTIKALFKELDFKNQPVGVFSEPRSLNTVVAEGDRIELYRPLVLDPKEARRQRARLRKKMP